MFELPWENCERRTAHCKDPWQHLKTFRKTMKNLENNLETPEMQCVSMIQKLPESQILRHNLLCGRRVHRLVSVPDPLAPAKPAR